MSDLALELFGTFASIVIAISLMMKNLKRLRYINLAGALLFALYGLGISSIPVFLVNGFIVFIDLWYILRMRKEQARFSLLHIGQTDSEYLKAFLDHYRADILRFHPSFKAEEATDSEAQRIRAALPAGAMCIALDERGATPTTKQLSQQMQDWMRQGRDVAFVIGGADGLHESIKQQAQQLVALSALTLPHGMVRVLLAEQLYRAHSLLHNHPYHRE